MRAKCIEQCLTLSMPSANAGHYLPESGASLERFMLSLQNCRFYHSQVGWSQQRRRLPLKRQFTTQSLKGGGSHSTGDHTGWGWEHQGQSGG